MLFYTPKIANIKLWDLKNYEMVNGGLASWCVLTSRLKLGYSGLFQRGGIRLLSETKDFELDPVPHGRGSRITTDILDPHAYFRPTA